MNPDLLYALNLTLVGIAIVFAVLAILAGVISLVRRSDEGWKLKEKQQEVEALEKRPNLDATTAVLIAAAVATMVAGRHRIRSVRRLLPQGGKASSWSAQGRAELMGSHSITRKAR
jgi:Na+-transporting methylmalonyl-CoA/oxaloacetate decarboxylase gamma subunit